ERLERELAAIPYLHPYPSRSNFVLCRVTGMEAAALRRRLAEEHGILIRHYNTPRLQDHVRISAGTPAQTDALLAALREIGQTSEVFKTSEV
ncbi:MAG: aminotransferase class I/II-fold pyridoxal phosphate-dependent enzyme, partial [Chloroflexota bacterium]